LKALDLLAEIGGRLGYLDAELEYSANIHTLIGRAQRLLQRYKLAQPWCVYLALILSELAETRLEAVLNRLHLPNDQKSIIQKGLAIQAQLPQINDGMDVRVVKNSQVYHLLKGKPEESLAIAYCLTSPGAPLRRLIRLYLEHLEQVAIELSGTDLVDMGFKQGPGIGKTLHLLLDAKLDGEIKSRDDEVKFVKTLMASI
jgi:tRNA nucleotidyltransferase (CCA-adding enzyme)